jgi:DNA-damage-inducible protein D
MSDLSLAQISTQSPFDSIRRVDKDGEFWSARELMPLLGSPRWAEFLKAIERAEVSCKTLEGSSSIHFRVKPEMVKLPQGGSTRRIDYRLSRYGSYLTAMNGDPASPKLRLLSRILLSKPVKQKSSFRSKMIALES